MVRNSRTSCSFKNSGMVERITDREIQYLLDHLDILYSGANLGEFLNREEQPGRPAITIPLSERTLDKSEVILIDDIPVLFPCSDQKQWYSTEGKGIRFHHDILKSAFYLLSGYQEVHTNQRDLYGRFPWESSIQQRLGITGKPVVNYYFEVILEAFKEFCSLNGLEFKKRKREAPSLFLSHDVDRIKKYSLRNMVYSFLQLVGLRPRSCSFRQQLNNLGIYARGLLSFRRDPYWTFEEMTAFEQELQFLSTWFFLERTRLNDSRYTFRKRKIRDLISYLSLRKHEIGLHGTWQSSEDAPALKRTLRHLNEKCEKPVVGIRQHFLRYNNPITPGIQEQSALLYDATLGFAEQPGFRNSYAYPFRLYDFEKREPMKIWQLPLMVMDVTLLEYMESSVESIPETIEPLLAEVTRFQGVFSLLWHNCRLDEEANPGINVTYRKLLKMIKQRGYVSLTGEQVIDSFHSAGQISS